MAGKKGEKKAPGRQSGGKSGQRDKGKAEAAPQRGAGRAASRGNYHSIFSFSDNELENVLHMFEGPPGSASHQPSFGHRHEQAEMELAQHSAMPTAYQCPPPYMQQRPEHVSSMPVCPTTMPMHGQMGGMPTMVTQQYPQDAQQMPVPGPMVKVEPGMTSELQIPPMVPHRFLPRGASTSKGQQSAKPTVSHSVAEKQRRDRINKLIDELRELVPPAELPPEQLQSRSSSDQQQSQPSNEDPWKRPKHIVLADTITFVKNVAAMVGHSSPIRATYTYTMVGSHGKPDRKEAKGGKDDASPERAEVESSSDESVVMTEDSVTSEETLEINVAHKPNANYEVNVKGKDRNGLLHDITRCLTNLELEIKHAVVQTENGGKVNDLFEVDKGKCTLSPDEIKTSLTDSLHSEKLLMGEVEVKRKRTLD